MDNNKLFVYDTTRGFGRIIKSKLSDEYDIYTCNVKGNMFNINMQKFNIAFVNINHYEELVDFLYIKSKIKFVFVISRIPEIISVTEKMDDVQTLDINLVKRDMTNQVLNNLKILRSA